MKGLVVANNEDKVVCSGCTDPCCKQYPGALALHDIPEPHVENLTRMLVSGRYAVDYWEGTFERDGKTFETPKFVRAAAKERNRLVDPLWSGECVFLAVEGCSLSFVERPFQCRVLLPNRAQPGKCNDTAPPGLDLGKKGSVLLWLDHQDVIETAIKAVRSVEE